MLWKQTHLPTTFRSELFILSSVVSFILSRWVYYKCLCSLFHCSVQNINLLRLWPLCGKAGKEGEYSMLCILHTSLLQIQGPSWTPCTENHLKDFIRAHSGETMQTTIFKDWLNLETITCCKLLVSKTALKKRKLFQKQTADGRARRLKHLKTCKPLCKLRKKTISLRFGTVLKALAGNCRPRQSMEH